MYPDVFSHQLINNKLIADAYAKSGEYLVYMPDFFKGEPVPLRQVDLLIPVEKEKQSKLSLYTGLLAFAPSFIMWMTRHKFEEMSAICNNFLTALRRATPKDRKIGMVGFCWGGRYALRAGLEGAMIPSDPSNKDSAKIPLVDAVVALHPSNLALPADASKPVVPLSVGWGLEDTNTPIKWRDQIQEEHKKNQSEGLKLPEIEHKVYKPGRHGFAVRGNPDDPEEKKCLEDSVQQVLDWFQRFL
jgi:dienelactone hydrolase